LPRVPLVKIATLGFLLCAASSCVAVGRASVSGQVVFASTRGDFAAHRYQVDVSGGAAHLVRADSGVLSPDGRWDARLVNDDASMRVEVSAVAGDVWRPVASFPRSGAGDGRRLVKVVWSPDSRRLAFVVLEGCSASQLYPCNIYDLWTVDRDGARLTHVSLHARTPSWAPDSKRLAFVGYVDRFSGDAILIGNADGSGIHAIVAGRNPVWAPHGDRILYSARVGDLSLIDASTGRHRFVYRRLGPPTIISDAVAWAPDASRFAFVVAAPPSSNGPDGVGVPPGRRTVVLYVEAASGGPATAIVHAALPVQATLPAWSPNGREIAYVQTSASFSEGTYPGHLYAAAPQVVVVAARGGSPRQVTHDGPFASFGALRWARDGRQLVYDETQTRADSELYLMNADGSGTTQLTRNYVDDRDPSWSPDGTRVLFRRSPETGWYPPVDAGIYTLDPATGAATQITTPSRDEYDTNPVSSPDGTEIAFARHTFTSLSNTSAIWLVQPDGSGLHQLTPGQHLSETPSWSPNSTMLAFSDQSANGDLAIYRINRDGTGLTTLTNSPTDAADAKEPTWSPDGTTIAYLGARTPGAWGIYTMTQNGANQRLIKTVTNPEGPPTWSPDGTRLLYTINLYYQSEIHSLAIDGLDDVVLTASNGGNTHPSWAP
jgi:Tol biopolymer transport system component